MVALAQRVDVDPVRPRSRGRRPRTAADRRAQAPLQPPLAVPRAGPVGSAHRGAVPPAVGRPPGAAGRRRVPRPVPRSAAPRMRRVAAVHESLPLRQCTARLSVRVPRNGVRPGRHGPVRRAVHRRPVAATSTPRSPARVPGRGRRRSAATRRAAPRAGGPAGGGGAIRGRRRAPRPGRRAASGPSGAGSAWSRWRPCRSWCSPGPTAPAAGTCRWSGAGGWSPPAARRRRTSVRGTLASLLTTAETRERPDGELAATVDETELVLRWMEKPGTRLVDLTGTLACPAPGHGRLQRLPGPGRGRAGRPRPVRRRRGRWAPGRGPNACRTVPRRSGRPASIAGVITAIVMIDAATDSIPEVAAAIAELDGVSEVYSVAGDVDLIAIVRVREFEQIAEVIAGRINKVPGVLEHRDPHRLPRLLHATTSKRRSRSASTAPTRRTASDPSPLGGPGRPPAARLTCTQRSSSATARPSSTAAAARPCPRRARRAGGPAARRRQRAPRPR